MELACGDCREQMKAYLNGSGDVRACPECGFGEILARLQMNLSERIEALSENEAAARRVAEEIDLAGLALRALCERLLCAAAEDWVQ